MERGPLTKRRLMIMSCFQWPGSNDILANKLVSRLRLKLRTSAGYEKQRFPSDCAVLWPIYNSLGWNDFFLSLGNQSPLSVQHGVASSGHCTPGVKPGPDKPVSGPTITSTAQSNVYISLAVFNDWTELTNQASGGDSLTDSDEEATIRPRL